MKIDYNKVREVKLRHLSSYIERKDMKENFTDSVDTEHHYKLLSYISNQKDNQLIYELGTHYGLSAVAFSTNKTNKIVTYDVVRRNTIQLPDNVEQRIGNIFELGQKDELLKADIIFLDTGHLGEFEIKIYTYLKNMNWKGILICDDIHFNSFMKNFWNEIDVTKYDVTEIGHKENPIGPEDNTGTGIVDFNNQIEILK
tara:strand:+ start:737 stop:1333 length:597 start_codon:yes stop_codon:yes gene_type:complete